MTLDNLAGMGWERPLLGVAMCTFMFGFAGLPLTGGFVGKFYAFSAAFRHGWTWLVIVGVVATAVSLYYYLAVVRAMYMRPTAELQLAPTLVPAGAIAAGGSPPRDAMLQTTVLLAMVGTIGSFVAVRAADPRRKAGRKLAALLGTVPAGDCPCKAHDPRTGSGTDPYRGLSLSSAASAATACRQKTTTQAISAERATAGTDGSPTDGARAAVATSRNASTNAQAKAWVGSALPSSRSATQRRPAIAVSGTASSRALKASVWAPK